VPHDGADTPPFPWPAPPSPHRTFPSRWRRLPLLAKIGLAVLGAVLLCCGGLTGIGLFFGPPTPASTPDQAAPPAAPAPVTVASPTPVGSTPTTPAGAPPTIRAARPTQPPGPVIQKHIVTETRSIAFATKTINDPTLDKGTREVRTSGAPGVRTLTYEVTLTDGVQTSKRLVRSVVTKSPTPRVIAVGTKTSPSCHPSYAGACVPIASDVDCAGGSGNGPAYVEGPVRIVGPDVYELDGNDNDGIGCED
jgi:resuscitation-promoting factor RpfB